MTTRSPRVDAHAVQQRDVGVQQHSRRNSRNHAAQFRQHHDRELLVEGQIAAKINGADVRHPVQHRQARNEQQHRTQARIFEKPSGRVGEGADQDRHRKPAQQVQRERRVVERPAGRRLTDDAFLGAQRQHIVDRLHEAGRQRDDAEIRRPDQANQHQRADQPKDAHPQPPGHHPDRTAHRADQQTFIGRTFGHRPIVIISIRMHPGNLDVSAAAGQDTA